MKNICSHEKCNEEGTFPAPRNPRDLSNRQYFCEKHIKEFNKNWNGLEGFSEKEMYAMEDTSTWNRPTWKFGIHGASAKASQFEFMNAEDLFSFFKARRMADLAKGRESYNINSKAPLPPDVKEACAIFSIEPPFCAAELKKKYIALMKKHHPDVNKGSKSAEEMVKKINVANKILSEYV